MLEQKLDKISQENQNQVVNIKISDVYPNGDQPRIYFDEDKIIALCESIKKHGVLQPIVVRPDDEGRYMIIAGERRLRAAKLANLKTIPAILHDMSDETSAVLALLENLQREDLNFIEEALGYENLIKEHNFTQQQLAQKLGKNQSTIANKLRILKLPQSIKESLVENGLTERHARALLKLPNEELMDEVIQKVTKNELTVKKTEKLIKDILESIELENNPEKKQNIKCSMSIRIYLNTLKQAYDAILNTGIEAKYNEIDKGDYMEVVVKIPKK